MVAAAAAPAASWLSTWGPSILSGAASIFGGRAANVASAREAQRNRDFQLMMSNTAHQREIKDLRAAGLNPILSVNKGATTGSGSMAPQHDVVTPAIHSAQAGRRLAAELSLLQQQTEKTKHEARNASNLADISAPAAASARTLLEAGSAAKDLLSPVADFVGDLPAQLDKAGEVVEQVIKEIQAAPAALQEKASSALQEAKEILKKKFDPGPENRKRAERQKLLDEWNALKIEYEKKKTGRRRREW